MISSGSDYCSCNVLRTTKIAFNQPWSGRHIWVTIAKNGHILPIYRLVKSILAQRVEMIEEWNMDRLDVSYLRSSYNSFCKKEIPHRNLESFHFTILDMSFPDLFRSFSNIMGYVRVSDVKSIDFGLFKIFMHIP